MYGAFDGVVAPSREQITGVDHDSSFDRSGIDELTCRTLDLETASVVLEQKGDGAIVLVMIR